MYTTKIKISNTATFGSKEEIDLIILSSNLPHIFKLGNFVAIKIHTGQTHKYYGFMTQGLLYQSDILRKSRWPTKTVHLVKIGACICSPGRGICLLAFGMDFKLGGWPLQPPTCQN